MEFLLHHLVENSAKKFPDRIAFRFLNKELSYKALNLKADQLAISMINMGVKRGDRVGIYLNKSLECAISIFGILKAGGAYVPLDPGAPLIRLDGIIRHCGISLLISHEPKRKSLNELVSDYCSPLDNIIGVDNFSQGLIKSVGWDSLYLELNPVLPTVGSIGQDLAYIMYTSGSTGEPKGIMHTHQSGLSYARMAADVYQVSHTDRLSNHSPLHFDMSTFDYFCAPLAGACTVIIAEAYTKLPVSLAELIETERLTIWYSVPFALIQLLSQGLLEKRDLSSLHLVMFGGEPFPSKYLVELMKQWPHARFSNVYGPAEVNQCTCYFVPECWSENAINTPIGDVCRNVEALVVNELDQFVADGESGELLIRSPTMMRGYWNQPELNQKAFFLRKVTDDISDIFYRTGDLVTVDEIGQLHFLGRKDRQIKLRGYRIELDELESVFASHPIVEEAAAYPIAGSDGVIEALEVAVTLMNQTNDSMTTLQQHASKLLPSYAVPEYVLPLKTFPRTPTGKIDRRYLSEKAQSRIQQSMDA